jgi:hypothetical protein
MGYVKQPESARRAQKKKTDSSFSEEKEAKRLLFLQWLG